MGLKELVTLHRCLGKRVKNTYMLELSLSPALLHSLGRILCLRKGLPTVGRSSHFS